MKYLSYVLVLSCPLSATVLPSQRFAQEWVRTHVITADGRPCLKDNELNLLLNFFYISYQQSHALIALQEKALALLQSAWHEWFLVTQLRREPASTQASDMQMSSHVHTFTKQLDKTKQVCSDHTTLATYLFEEIVLSDQATRAIESAQAQEQVVLAHTIAELNQDIQGGAQPPLKGSSILDFVWSCLPPLAIDSFIKTDRMTMHISQENWNLLYSLQKLTNYNWTLVENGKAALYYALYKELYESVNHHSNAAQFFTSFFRQNQNIPAP